MELLSNIYIYIVYIEVNLHEYRFAVYFLFYVTRFFTSQRGDSCFFNSPQLSILYTSRKEYCYCTQRFNAKKQVLLKLFMLLSIHDNFLEGKLGMITRSNFVTQMTRLSVRE